MAKRMSPFERPLAACHRASVKAAAPLMQAGLLCVNSAVFMARLMASFRSFTCSAMGDIMAITSLLSRGNGFEYSLSHHLFIVGENPHSG